LREGAPASVRIDGSPQYHARHPGIQALREALREGSRDEPPGHPRTRMLAQRGAHFSYNALPVLCQAAMRVVVCDVGLGNLRSVERALREAGRGRAIEVEITRDAARIASADKLVMPGQGGFRDCAQALSGELGDAIRAHVASGRPYLGICLGLQILFSASDEAPGYDGLSLVEGHVARISPGIDPATGARFKIPHMGWNTVEPTDNQGLLPPGSPTHFYFVHSYAVQPKDSRYVAATTEYGSRFVSAVAFDNVFACQFHPEKSQRAGLALLDRFLAS